MKGVEPSVILEWSGLIRGVALKNGIPSAEVEDFESQIYLEWLEGDYASKFDPDKGKLGTFVWAFCKTRAMRDRDKGLREESHRSSAVLDDDFDEDTYTVQLRDPCDHIEEHMLETELGDFLEELKATVPVIEVVYFVHEERDLDGRKTQCRYRVERSLYTLTQMLLAGMSQREIAAVYGRSVGTVSSMVQELRKLPLVVRRVLGVSTEL